MNDNEGRHAPAANSYITGPENSECRGRRVRLAFVIAAELERIAETPGLSPVLRWRIYERAALSRGPHEAAA